MTSTDIYRVKSTPIERENAFYVMDKHGGHKIRIMRLLS